MTNRILLLTSLFTLVIGTTTALAQETGGQATSLSRLSFGLYTTNAAVSPGVNSQMELGGGLGIAVGYALSPRFEVHSLTSSAYMAWDDYFLTNFDLEGRYLVRTRSSRWVPHLALGASARTPHYDDSNVNFWNRSTLALNVGGGISYHLSSAVALDWSIRHAWGNFVRSSCASSIDAEGKCATTTRVSFGVSWFPFSR